MGSGETYATVSNERALTVAAAAAPPPKPSSVARRVIALLLVTWAPMCVLAIVDGHAIASTPRESFLLDFATYARFFIAGPLLLVAELVIMPRMSSTARQLESGGFVRPEEQEALARSYRRLTVWRDSRWVIAALVALAFFGAWNLTIERVQGVETGSWQTVASGAQALRHSLAGLWNHFIAMPVLLFLFYRWVWRLVVWTVFLGSAARLDLQLLPGHADGAGGLGFLESIPKGCGLLALAFSSILCAAAAFRIVFEQARLASFQGPLIIAIVMVELALLGPLLLFTPRMLRAKGSGLREYGDLVARYNREFQRKWIGSATSDTPLLGSPDIQSFADIGNSFEFVRRMRLTPFGTKTIARVAVMTLLPVLPVLFATMPLSEIFRALSKLMF